MKKSIESRSGKPTVTSSSIGGMVLDGKPLDVTQASPLAKKILQALESLPDGEFLSSSGLADKVRTTGAGLSEHARASFLAANKTLVFRPRKMLIWSSKKNIELLKRHIADEAK